MNKGTITLDNNMSALIEQLAIARKECLLVALEFEEAAYNLELIKARRQEWVIKAKYLEESFQVLLVEANKEIASRPTWAGIQSHLTKPEGIE